MTSETLDQPRVPDVASFSANQRARFSAEVLRPSEVRVLVDVAVVELLREGLERLPGRHEVDGEVVALQLLRLENRLDAVGVAVERLGPALVVDQVVRRLEARGDGDAVGQFRVTPNSPQHRGFARHGEARLLGGRDREERLEDLLRRRGLAGRLVEVDLEEEARASRRPGLE